MAMNRGTRSRFSEHETQGMVSQASDYVARGYQQAEHLVAENPGWSVLVFFGIGLGMGVAVGSLLARSEPPPSAAERFGRQVIEAISKMVPESLASRLPS